MLSTKSVLRLFLLLTAATFTTSAQDPYQCWHDFNIMIDVPQPMARWCCGFCEGGGCCIDFCYWTEVKNRNPLEAKPKFLNARNLIPSLRESVSYTVNAAPELKAPILEPPKRIAKDYSPKPEAAVSPVDFILAMAGGTTQTTPSCFCIGGGWKCCRSSGGGTVCSGGFPGCADLRPKSKEPVAELPPPVERKVVAMDDDDGSEYMCCGLPLCSPSDPLPPCPRPKGPRPNPLPGCDIQHPWLCQLPLRPSFRPGA